MSDIICVTDRKLCREDFLERIERIALSGPKAVILREKDLSEAEYGKLAEDVMKICRCHNVSLILHSFAKKAVELGADAVHMPLNILRLMSEEEKAGFNTIGASCHSLKEALEAEQLGCTYITAGHIFDTDCKKGTPGRGLEFLTEICRTVSLPVYAIGGISPDNIDMVRSSGAAGGCVMSGLMTCENPAEYLCAFETVHRKDK